MRYLIGERHRRIILGRLPKAGRMLEFGSGTSTHWFARRLPEDASIVSVEHDPAWFHTVRDMLDPFGNARQILAQPDGTLGPNASQGEERADLLKGYIHAADPLVAEDGLFDVILVDGVARDACLEHARTLLAPGGTIFLHDAQRPWYDRGKRTLTAHGHAGSCPDYPGPHLWWGGTEQLKQPATTEGELPLIVSYYTSGTPYEDEARGLIASLAALGLEHRVASLPVTGSWIETCGRKVRVIRDAWRETGRSILWLDADARVHAMPTLLAGTQADFAIRCFDGWAFGTGTCFFNSTPLAGLLLDDWLHRVETEPMVGEQIHLDRAWEQLSCRAELATLWLPPSYATIFDEPGRSAIEPVIEHFQASRRFAPSQQGPDRVEVHNTEARVARLARRPMEHLVAHTWKHPDVPQHQEAVGHSGLPDSIKGAMLDRLALDLLTTGIRSVALYGAGRFTRRHAMSAMHARGIDVVAVIDDAAGLPPVEGLAVSRPAKAATDDRIEAVIVCSDAHETDLAASARAVFAPLGVPVLRVFDWRAVRPAAVSTLRAG